MNRAEELANVCLEETGVGRMSVRSREITLVAISLANEDRKAWKKSIRKAYQKRHPNCGSVFILVILPIIVSLIAQWLGKWLFKERTETISTLQSEARSALGWSPE